MDEAFAADGGEEALVLGGRGVELAEEEVEVGPLLEDAVVADALEEGGGGGVHG